MVDVYLIPHHDDEIFLIDHLIKFDSKTSKAIFIYLTYDNERSLQIAESRKAASEKVLKKVCSFEFSVINLGEELGISHRKLNVYQEKVILSLQSKIEELTKEHKQEIRLYAPLFENGHVDHIQAFWVLYKLGLSVDKNYYSTYSFDSRNFPRVQIENKSGFQNSVQRRFRRMPTLIKAMRMYKTEFNTWVALGPLLLLKSFKPKFRHSIFSEKEMLATIRNHQGVIANPAINTIKDWQVDPNSYRTQLQALNSHDT
jgi:hypothetical protein